MPERGAHTLSLTKNARSDIADIMRYTRIEFGAKATDAYEKLSRQALDDIRIGPFMPGSKERPEIGDGIRNYHIALSRERSEPRIKSPRHPIFYFLPNDDRIMISRVPHDSSNLARHIPQAHRDKASKAKTKKQE